MMSMMGARLDYGDDAIAPFPHPEGDVVLPFWEENLQSNKVEVGDGQSEESTSSP